MPGLTKSNPQTLVKLLLIGHSGSGKTGALASLVKAGFSLGILDFDNKVAGGILPKLLTDEETKRVSYVPLRDKFKSSPTGPVPDGMPKAFQSAMKLLEKWEDGTDPAKWGPDRILVLDSLTFMGTAAHDWAKAFNPTAKEPRTWFYTAQGQLEDVLGWLTHESFQTNVIVTSHITFLQLQEGMTKGFPSSIGKAIANKIPGYFEHLGVAESKRPIPTITFQPNPFIDAKTPVLDFQKTLTTDVALAEFFKAARR